MSQHNGNPRKCLLCPAPIYDQAALCVDCERNLDDREDGLSPARLDALAPVRREPTRAQRDRK